MPLSKSNLSPQRKRFFERYPSCRPTGRRVLPIRLDKPIQYPISKAIQEATSRTGQGSPAKPPHESVPDAISSNVREILSVASRVASMPDRDAVQRYHTLVDQSLTGRLSPNERFELERIEARLDAGDRDPLIEARDRELQADRDRLLKSIHTLIAKLQM